MKIEYTGKDLFDELLFRGNTIHREPELESGAQLFLV